MHRKLEQAKREEGFTLIELLVVVIIIGILAAIAIPVFLNQRERAWQAELTSGVRNVALEIESRATAAGGDYTAVVADDAAVNTIADNVLGADHPLTFSETSGDTTAFAMCAEHDSIDTGSVSYASATGGLEDFVEADCGA